MKNIIIVSPAFNEEKGLKLFTDEFYLWHKKLLELGYFIRLIIVNDGSSDNTELVLEKLIAESSFSEILAYISLQYNAGYQNALVVGMLNAAPYCDAVVTMDSDLEHPFEVIPSMIKKWEEGYKLVGTRRNTNLKVGVFKTLLSLLYYKFMKIITGLNIKSGMADFKLWDSSLISSISPQLESLGSVRILSSYLPVKKYYISYDQNLALQRISRFTFKKQFNMFIDSVIRFSNFPLKLILFFGVFSLFGSFIYTIYIFFVFMHNKAVPGWTSLILLVLYFSSVILISLGIIAIYIDRILFKRDFPKYVVSHKKGTIF